MDLQISADKYLYTPRTYIDTNYQKSIQNMVNVTFLINDTKMVLWDIYHLKFLLRFAGFPLPVSLRLRMGNATPVEVRVSGMENCKARKNPPKKVVIHMAPAPNRLGFKDGNKMLEEVWKFCNDSHSTFHLLFSRILNFEF